MRTRPVLILAITAGLAASGCDREPKTAEEIKKEAPVTANANPEVAAAAAPSAAFSPLGESVVADFNKRVQDYVALRDKLIAGVKKLSDKATPQQIDAYQRELAPVIANGRATAKKGDIFSPEMQTFVRGLLKRVLSGPDGAKTKASLMDENPMGVTLNVNGRYPDTIPLSTMPPDVLSALPKLPEDLEYRFVGNRLVLLDVKTHLIVDFVENVFPI